MYLSVVDVGTTVIPYYRDTFTNRYKMYRRRELNAAAVRFSSLNQSLDATSEDVEDLPTYANTQELPEYRVAAERPVPEVNMVTVEGVNMQASEITEVTEANNNNSAPNSLCPAPTQNLSRIPQLSSQNQSLNITTEDVQDPPTYTNTSEVPERRIVVQRAVTEVTWVLPEYRVAAQRPMPEITRVTQGAVNMPVPEVIDATKLTEAEQKIYDVAKNIWSRAKPEADHSLLHGIMLQLSAPPREPVNFIDVAVPTGDNRLVEYRRHYLGGDWVDFRIWAPDRRWRGL